MDPTFWGSWRTLAKLLKNKNQLQVCGNYILRQFIMYIVYVTPCSSCVFGNPTFFMGILEHFITIPWIFQDSFIFGFNISSTNYSLPQTLPVLPHHWMKNFFYVEVCQEMYYANDALSFIQVALRCFEQIHNDPYFLSVICCLFYTRPDPPPPSLGI